MLGEHDLAVQAYELALQSDGDNEDAAMPLLTEYAVTVPEDIAPMVLIPAGEFIMGSAPREGPRRGQVPRGLEEGRAQQGGAHGMGTQHRGPPGPTDGVKRGKV